MGQAAYCIQVAGSGLEFAAGYCYAEVGGHDQLFGAEMIDGVVYGPSFLWFGGIVRHCYAPRCKLGWGTHVGKLECKVIAVVSEVGGDGV